MHECSLKPNTELSRAEHKAFYLIAEATMKAMVSRRQVDAVVILRLFNSPLWRCFSASDEYITACGGLTPEISTITATGG